MYSRVPTVEIEDEEESQAYFSPKVKKIAVGIFVLTVIALITAATFGVGGIAGLAMAGVAAVSSLELGVAAVVGICAAAALTATVAYAGVCLLAAKMLSSVGSFFKNLFDCCKQPRPFVSSVPAPSGEGDSLMRRSQSFVIDYSEVKTPDPVPVPVTAAAPTRPQINIAAVPSVMETKSATPVVKEARSEITMPAPSVVSLRAASAEITPKRNSTNHVVNAKLVQASSEAPATPKALVKPKKVVVAVVNKSKEEEALSEEEQALRYKRIEVGNASLNRDYDALEARFGTLEFMKKSYEMAGIMRAPIIISRPVSRF